MPAALFFLTERISIFNVSWAKGTRCILKLSYWHRVADSKKRINPVVSCTFITGPLDSVCTGSCVILPCCEHKMYATLVVNLYETFHVVNVNNFVLWTSVFKTSLPCTSETGGSWWILFLWSCSDAGIHGADGWPKLIKMIHNQMLTLLSEY